MTSNFRSCHRIHFGVSQEVKQTPPVHHKGRLLDPPPFPVLVDQLVISLYEEASSSFSFTRYIYQTFHHNPLRKPSSTQAYVMCRELTRNRSFNYLFPPQFYRASRQEAKNCNRNDEECHERCHKIFSLLVNYRSVLSDMSVSKIYVEKGNGGDNHEHDANQPDQKNAQ